MRSGGAALCCWPQHSSSELSPPELPAPAGNPSRYASRPVSDVRDAAGVRDAGEGSDVRDAEEGRDAGVVRAVVARRSWRSHTDLPALHAHEQMSVCSAEESRRDASKRGKESANQELRAADRATADRAADCATADRATDCAARAYSFRLRDERGGPERLDSGAGINQCISKLSTYSVEAVDYADATFYLRDSVTDVSSGDVIGDVVVGDVVGDVMGDVSRCRVVSDGDILSPRGRPESGAFSESDVEWWSSPPTRRVACASHTETAI